MRRIVCALGILLLALAPPAGAQIEEPLHLQWAERESEAATPGCVGGLVYDDGSFADGYSLGNGDPGDATIAMRFDLPAGTTSLDQVCIGFTRTASGPTSMTFEIVVYDDNGASGQPGTFLGAVTADASFLPLFPAVQFFDVNLATSGIVMPDSSVYIGARWPGGYVFMAGDRSAATTQRTIYGSGNSGSTWTSAGSLYSTMPPRAMAIRANPGTATATCVPSATAMCLANNRFRVSATWETGSASGSAQVVKLTADSGYLWFFSATNIEAVIKVLDACGLNNRFWVFAGGLTDVRTVITVTDTETGAYRQFINPQATPFQPIQDTSAFTTCP